MSMDGFSIAFREPLKATGLFESMATGALRFASSTRMLKLSITMTITSGRPTYADVQSTTPGMPYSRGDGRVADYQRACQTSWRHAGSSFHDPQRSCRHLSSDVSKTRRSLR